MFSKKKVIFGNRIFFKKKQSYFFKLYVHNIVEIKNIAKYKPGSQKKKQQHTTHDMKDNNIQFSKPQSIQTKIHHNARKVTIRKEKQREKR